MNDMRTPGARAGVLKLGGLAVLLVALVVVLVVLLSQKPSAENAAATHKQPAAASKASTFAATGAGFTVTGDGDSTAALEALGIALAPGAELSRQGLVGVPGVDPSRPSKSISSPPASLRAATSCATECRARSGS